jgi:hypothetical protein
MIHIVKQASHAWVALAITLQIMQNSAKIFGNMFLPDPPPPPAQADGHWGARGEWLVTLHSVETSAWSCLQSAGVKATQILFFQNCIYVDDDYDDDIWSCGTLPVVLHLCVRPRGLAPPPPPPPEDFYGRSTLLSKCPLHKPISLTKKIPPPPPRCENFLLVTSEPLSISSPPPPPHSFENKHPS